MPNTTKSVPCPECGGETIVIDGRLQKKTRQKRRRRECRHCKFRITTIEHMADANCSIKLTEKARLIVEMIDLMDRLKQAFEEDKQPPDDEIPEETRNY